MIPELSAIARQAARSIKTYDSLDQVADAVTTAVLQEVKRMARFRFGEYSVTTSELDALLALSAPLLQSESTEKKELMRAAPTRESIEPLPNASETEGRTSFCKSCGTALGDE